MLSVFSKWKICQLVKLSFIIIFDDSSENQTNRANYNCIGMKKLHSFGRGDWFSRNTARRPDFRIQRDLILISRELHRQNIIHNMKRYIHYASHFSETAQTNMCLSQVLLSLTTIYFRIPWKPKHTVYVKRLTIFQKKRFHTCTLRWAECVARSFYGERILMIRTSVKITCEKNSKSRQFAGMKIMRDRLFLRTYQAHFCKAETRSTYEARRVLNDASKVDTTLSLRFKEETHYISSPSSQPQPLIPSILTTRAASDYSSSKPVRSFYKILIQPGVFDVFQQWLFSIYTIDLSLLLVTEFEYKKERGLVKVQMFKIIFSV